MPRPRLVLAAACAVVAAGVALAAPAGAATGTVHTTSGKALTIRASASTGAAAVGSLANGASFTFDCQAHGGTVTGRYGTSDVWDHVTGRGYVSDTYVYTGSDGLVAPLCGAGTPCSISGTGDPHTCAQAVSWATAHLHSGSEAGYAGLCDHLVGLAYGFAHSGSATAAAHWAAIPSSYRHAGSSTVPAGGLAFFSGGSSGAGHVMISIGGGTFVSNDIHGSGSYTRTTIAEITSTWGEHYLGWAQPWFRANH